MASGNIKGIKIEIGGETTGLTKALNSVKKESNAIQKELKDVERLLKLDPKNTELLAQKQELLGQQINTTKDKLQALKTAKEKADSDMKNGTEVNEKQYRELQREIAATEQQLKKLKQQTSNLAAAGEKIKSVGQGISSVGKAAMPVTGAIAGIGAAAVASFNDVDDGADVVIKKTGAVGDQAKMLDRVYKDVAKKMPASFEDIGSAVGEINTRLGFTGEELTGASEQFLKFARINDTDVNTAVQLVTRAMGDAGISTNEYGSTLDMLTTAAQASGISVDKLSENLAKYGAPMRALGFDTKSAIAIFGTWEKAGVNTEIAFSGMKKAISNWGKSGKDSTKEFQKAITAIQKAPTVAEATTKAIEIFGAKAGPDLADAIRGGRFEVEAMLEALQNSDGSTATTFDNVIDGADDMQVAMNNAKLAFAGIGETIMSTLSPILQSLSRHLQAVSEWFSNLNPSGQKMVVMIGVIAAAIPPLLIVIGTLVTSIGAITTAISGMNFAFLASPITWVIAGVTALVAVFVVLWNKCEGFREFWTGLWDGIKNIASGAWNTIKDKAGPAIDGVKSMWGEAQPYFSAIWDGIKVAASVALENIAAYFKASWEIIKSVWNIAVSFFSTIWENIKLIFSVVGDVLSGDFSGAWEGVKQIWSNTAGFFKTVWENIKNIFSTVINYFKTIFSNAWNGVKSVWSGAGSFFSNIVNNIASFFQELPKKLIKAGKDMIAGLWNGINDKIAWLKGKVQGVVDTIKGWFTGKKGFDEHSPSKWSEKVFKYVMEGGKIGIEKNQNKITDAIQNLIDNVKLKYELGITTEEEYYNAIADIRDEYLEEGSSAWWNYTKELINYEKSIAESTKKEMQSTFQAVTDEAEKSMNDIESKQKSFLSKIRGNMAMYETRTVTIGEKSASADVLTDWREKTAATQEYIGAITTLQNRVQSLFSIDEQGQFTEFMETIRTEDAAEGRKITELLMGLTDADLSEYVSGWKEYLAITESAADDTYAAEAESIKVGFVDKVLSMIQALPEEFRTQGEKAADFFGAALTEKIKNILSGLNDMIVNSIPNMELNSLAVGALGVQRYYTTNQTKTSNITINSYVETAGASPYQASQANKAMISGLQKEGRL